MWRRVTNDGDRCDAFILLLHSVDCRDALIMYIIEGVTIDNALNCVHADFTLPNLIFVTTLGQGLHVPPAALGKRKNNFNDGDPGRGQRSVH